MRRCDTIVVRTFLIISHSFILSSIFLFLIFDLYLHFPLCNRTCQFFFCNHKYVHYCSWFYQAVAMTLHNHQAIYCHPFVFSILHQVLPLYTCNIKNEQNNKISRGVCTCVGERERERVSVSMSVRKRQLCRKEYNDTT